MDRPAPEWPWRADDAAGPGDKARLADRDRIARLAARCFRGEDGAQLIAYLKALTLDRVLGPDAADAALRHLEGQRCLVRHLCRLIDLGRDGPGIPPDQEGDDA